MRKETRHKTKSSNRKLLSVIIYSIFIPLLSFAEAKKTDQSTAAFNSWKAKYGAKIGLKTWLDSNPKPYTSYFSPTSKKCVESWYVSLGPLGINTLMHDRSWVDVFPACKEIAPKVLTDEHGLVLNAYEVKVAKPNGPAAGLVKEGDLIIKMSGQKLKAAQLTYLGKPLGNKDCRGLEIHAGQLIDKAEGRGEIKLTVLRIPNNKKQSLHSALKGLRSWKTIKTVSGNEFNVILDNVDLCRLTAGKGVKIQNLTLANASGVSFPVTTSGKRGGNLLSSHLAIPAGKWQLSGTLTAKRSASVKIETLPYVELPHVFDKYTKEIELKIPKIGSFGSSFDPNGEKAQNYSQMLAHRIATQQNEDGSWSAKSYGTPAFYTAMCGIGLLSTNDPQYSSHIRKAAYYVANGPWDKWTYTYGLRLTFLGEYYLRTKDKGILPGLKTHLAESRQYILADYTAGHGSNPGYGGSGYIGGGGMLACGLAVASHTPAASTEDKIILDKMLERVQQIAPNGKVPYGRAYNGVEKEPVKGQGGSCGTGPYFFASLIRGGASHFVKTAAKRYGCGPWGTAENGHATQTLHFVWGALASANCGSKAHRGCMNSYLWKFTTLREFDGFVNQNNFRTEYHNGDGVIGAPYWRTAGYLLLMNAHKRNLAITGSAKFRAKKFKNTPLVFHRDMASYNFIKRSWYLAEAILGEHTPKSMASSIKRLEALPKDENLGANLRKFLKSHAITVARDIIALKKTAKNINTYQLAESVLGVSFEASCTPNLEMDMDDNYSGGKQANKNNDSSSGSSSKEDKKAAKKDAKKAKNKLLKDMKSGKVAKIEHILTLRPISLIQKDADTGKNATGYSSSLYDFGNISVSITDPSKNYLKKTLHFKPGTSASSRKKNALGADTLQYSFQMKLSEQSYLNVSINYTIDGVPMSYNTQMPIPAKEARSYVPNLTRLKVKGTVSEDYRGVWTCRVKLNTGRIVGCEQWFKPTDYILAGTPCEFEISPTGNWGHNIRAVRKLKPSYRIAKPDNIAIGGTKFSGELASLCDFNEDSGVTLRDKGTCTISYSYNKPVKISSRYIKAMQKGQNVGKLNTKIEAFVNNKWQVIRASSVSPFCPTLTAESNKFRVTLDVPKGGLEIQELNLNLTSTKRSSSKIKRELTW